MYVSYFLQQSVYHQSLWTSVGPPPSHQGIGFVTMNKSDCILCLTMDTIWQCHARIINRENDSRQKYILLVASTFYCLFNSINLYSDPNYWTTNPFFRFGLLSILMSHRRGDPSKSKVYQKWAGIRMFKLWTLKSLELH